MKYLIRFFLQILIGLISIFILSFYLFYGTNDLFRFPFYSEVWGNASGWLMILVTIVTAFFLWKTLNSQQEIQKSQLEILEMEKERFRMETIPNFDISFMDYDLPKDYSLLCPSIRIELKSNIAREIKLKIDENSKFKIQKNESTNIPPTIYKGFYFYMNLNYNDYKVTDRLPNAIMTKVVLTFQDFKNNDYSQSIIYRYNKKDDKLILYITEPELLIKTV